MPTYEQTDALIEQGQAHVRFRAFSERFQDEEIQLVVENQIWFSDVRALDDAYEGRPQFVWADALPTRVDLLDLSFRQASHVPLFDRLVMVDGMLRDILDPNISPIIMAQMENETRNIYDRSSICCFNRNPRSQRFWGQYANNGTGYALLFDFRYPWLMQSFMEAPPIAMVPFPVTYVEGMDRPRLELSLARSERRGFEDIEIALLSKSSEWRDQAEERIIRVGIPGGYVRFNPISLSAVILGYHSEQFAERRSRLIRVCQEREIPIYLARLTLGSYELRLDSFA